MPKNVKYVLNCKIYQLYSLPDRGRSTGGQEGAAAPPYRVYSPVVSFTPKQSHPNCTVPNWTINNKMTNTYISFPKQSTRLVVTKRHVCHMTNIMITVKDNIFSNLIMFVQYLNITQRLPSNCFVCTVVIQSCEVMWQTSCEVTHAPYVGVRLQQTVTLVVWEG